MEHEDIPVWLLFKYEGKEYRIELRDKITGVYKDEKYGDGDGNNWFWWEEGNGACQCNRSIYIKQFFPDFPLLEQCGDSIELLDYGTL